jgi:hypothetical protein
MTWCGIAKDWCLYLSHLGRELIMTNRGYLGLGAMLGLSAAASIFSGTPEVPKIITFVYLVSRPQFESC